jgi:membrane protein DedA with SNARE-associated domain
MDPVLDLGHLISHWGYLAVFLFVLLGNLGLPVPEESILILSGYLVYQGELRLSLVLVVGIVSCIAGDNLGYGIGRRYGQGAILRYGHLVRLTPARLDRAQQFVSRFGAFAVFAARFVTGIRFLAGPLAGSTGLAPLTFVTANALGAIVYVPTTVGIGYAVAYGLGDYVKQFEGMAGRVEHIVLIAAVIVTAAVLGRRALGARGPRQGT